MTATYVLAVALIIATILIAVALRALIRVIRHHFCGRPSIMVRSPIRGHHSEGG